MPMKTMSQPGPGSGTDEQPATVMSAPTTPTTVR